MKVRILHLYPDCMSLYGERANVMVLRRHLEALGVSAAVEGALFEDVPSFEAADFLYMGAGTERTQKAALRALLPHREKFLAAVDRGAVVLFTGNAMETLGASVTDREGRAFPGLGLAGFTTRETHRRAPHDVIARSALWEAPVVGFMNKCSLTSGVEAPLFSALPLGFGNEEKGGPEGYTRGNVFATHITGPILAKNPAFLSLLLRRLFDSQGRTPPEGPLTDPLEDQAYSKTLAELSRRI